MRVRIFHSLVWVAFELTHSLRTREVAYDNAHEKIWRARAKSGCGRHGFLDPGDERALIEGVSRVEVRTVGSPPLPLVMLRLGRGTWEGGSEFQ
jgi:hypothetical protein